MIGEIDLVGLMFFFEVGSELEDYKWWVDLVFEYNL